MAVGGFLGAAIEANGPGQPVERGTLNLKVLGNGPTLVTPYAKTNGQICMTFF